MALISLNLTGVANGLPNNANDVVNALNAIVTQCNGNLDPNNIDQTDTYVWTGSMTFNAGVCKIKGAGSGIVSLQNQNTSNSRTLTLPDPLANDTLVSVRQLGQGLYNISFAQGADSSQLKITSANGTALSAANPGYVVIRSSTAGTSRFFTVTADVTIDLTGAHWGLDGKGNVTGALLRIYAADDNNSLKWGVGYQGGFDYIRNTQDDTTAANINLPEEILVNSNITTDNSPVLDVGHISADFTDATNEWAITGYFPGLKSADGKWQPWSIQYSAGWSVVPSGGVAVWAQYGKTINVLENRSSGGTSNATSATMVLPIKAKTAHDLYIVKCSDNGSVQNSPGLLQLTASSTTMNGFKTIAGGTFTAAGAKKLDYSILYEMYQP